MNRARAFLAAVGMATLPVLAHEHAEQWTLAEAYSPASTTAQADDFFARAVGNATEGRLSIIVMTDGRLGFKSTQQLKAVAEGHCAMATTVAAALSAQEHIFSTALFSYPGRDGSLVRRSFEERRAAYDAALARHNQKLLWASPLPPRGIGPVAIAFTTVNLDRWKSLDESERSGIEQAAAQTENRVWASLDEWAAKQ